MSEVETTHGERIFLYVIGTCQRLVEKGILQGGKYQLSVKGRAEYERLKASGFRPTDDEMRAAMACLQSDEA